MRNVKRICSVLLCAALLLCVCAGCSTPPVAMTVDGVDVSTGEYLANLYSNFYTMYYNNYLYMYESYGLGDPWEQSFNYSDTTSSTTKPMDTATYIKQVTQDSIIRQRAVVKLMEQFGLAVSEEDIKEIDESLANVSESALIAMGFNKTNYRKMVIATSYNEKTLFYGLYDEGGEKAVPEADVRKYFDDNYLVYKSVEMSLVDKDGKDLSEEKIAEIREKLEGYLKIYEDTGDFDKAIEKYTEDSKAATSTTTSSTKKADTITTTTVTTTTTAATTTTTGTGTTATGTGEGEGETEEEEEPTDPNVKEIVAEKYSDEAFVKVLREVEEGTAAIKTYKKNGTSNTMVLILRMDPEGEGREDYYKDSREGVLQNMKWDEYDEMVTTLAVSLTVEVNKRALNMCDPKDFVSAG